MPDKIFAQIILCNKLAIMSDKMHSDVGGKSYKKLKIPMCTMPNSQPTGISTNINIGLPLHNQPLKLNKIWD